MCIRDSPTSFPSANLAPCQHTYTVAGCHVITPVHQGGTKDETQKLLAAGHIREIQYPEWLANVVLVKKSSGKWRMCVDFTDLNKACPKDSYPLPSINALVDSASGCKLLSFLDAFSGYNQIKMHPMDEEKTAFMTERSCYCYNVMPFGLKNAGATYQRLRTRCSHLCSEGMCRRTLTTWS